MNVQPFLAAVSQIRTVVNPRQTLVGGAPFLSAVRSYQAALAPEHIPNLHPLILQGLNADVDRLARRVAEGDISKVEARAFIGGLVERRLWPERNADEDAITDMIQRVIETGPTATALQMTQGASRMLRGETIRGFGLLVTGAAAMHKPLQQSSLRSSHRHIDPPTIRLGHSAETSTVETQAELIPARPRPFSTHLADGNRYLMTEGISYDDQGREIEGAVRSPYRFVTWDEEKGEPIPFAIGGCSRVFLAHEMDEEGEIQRVVAIKIVTINDEDKRDALRHSFRNEKKLQKALSSDEFVHVHASGITATGNPYIAMEMVDGGSLDDFIIDAYENRGGLSEDVVIQTAIGMAKAVAIAHNVAIPKDDGGFIPGGIVHRDIKPANFMRMKDGQIKLADFGLAELAANLSPEPPEDIYGTVGYFPFPIEPDTPKRDVFALASSYYELSTGESAFQGATSYAVMIDTYQKDYEELRAKMAARGRSEALIRIILKGLSKNAQERHEKASELVFELMTVKAHALEEEAKAILRLRFAEGDYPKKPYDLWRKKIEEALREYGRVHKEEPNEYIVGKMVALNLQLYRYGNEIGDDELKQQTADIIHYLAPGSEADDEINRSIRVKISVEGSRPHPRSQQQLVIEGFADENGFLVKKASLGPYDQRISRTYDLPRNYSYRAVYKMDGALPVSVPLPPHQGTYDIRIPIYQEQKIPEFARRWTVIPAGPVVVKNRKGSYSEKPEVARETTRDILMGAPIDCRLWTLYFLKVKETLGLAEAKKRIPAGWKWDSVKKMFVTQHGRPVPLDTPVTHVPIGYFNDLYKEMLPGSRHPILNEWKRALRGTDGRPWPWGNAAPDDDDNLIAGCRHFNHPIPVAPLPNGMKGILDHSPLSVYADDPEDSHIVPHIALNILKVLQWPDSREDRERILMAVGLIKKNDPRAVNENPDDPTIPERYVFLVGSPYDQAAPTNVEMIQYKPIDFIGPVGAIPVLPLEEAQGTPTIASLLDR